MSSFQLTFDASDYLGSMLNLSLFKSDVEYPQLDEKLDKKDWRNHGYVALVQAFYDSSENSIGKSNSYLPCTHIQT